MLQALGETRKQFERKLYRASYLIIIITNIIIIILTIIFTSFFLLVIMTLTITEMKIITTNTSELQASFPGRQ